MTLDDLFTAVDTAPVGEKTATAERLLKEYAEADKPLIEGDVMAMAWQGDTVG